MGSFSSISILLRSGSGAMFPYMDDRCLAQLMFLSYQPHKGRRIFRHCVCLQILFGEKYSLFIAQKSLCRMTMSQARLNWLFSDLISIFIYIYCLYKHSISFNILYREIYTVCLMGPNNLRPQI